MVELSTIARPYAEALFQTARASGESLDRWVAATEDLAAVVSHPQVAQVVGDPKLSDEQVFQLISGMMRTPLPAGGDNFVQLLIANQRLAALPEVAAQLKQLKNNDEGVADCLIESAFPIDQTQVRELLAALASRFSRQLRPTVTVNPELIGGVRVVVGDQVLDGSVRAQLQNMRSALTA